MHLLVYELYRYQIARYNDKNYQQFVPQHLRIQICSYLPGTVALLVSNVHSAELFIEISTTLNVNYLITLT